MTDEIPAPQPGDGSDTVTIAYRPPYRRPCRVIFERLDREGPDWLRIEQTAVGDGDWRTVGTELADALTIEDDRDD